MGSDRTSPCDAPNNCDTFETTPLLENERVRESPKKGASVPLRRGQIILLCYARLMESIAFYSGFPYIPEMIRRNGRLRESDVGFYTGVVESSSAVAETLVLAFWCYLADRIGRKPALVCSLIGMAIGHVLFGLSRSIVQMILSRFVSGVFSGAGLIIRTMIGEQTTPETEAVAYSWYSMTDSLGAFIGPVIGGSLVNPVTEYPDLFRSCKFLKAYPYALPGFIIGAFNITGAITSTLFLEETLDKATLGTAGTSQNSTAHEHTTVWQLAKTPGIFVALSVYGQVILVASIFFAVLPVALYTPISLGGIGYTTSRISLYMGAQACSQALWLLVAFPWLQRRIGTKEVLRISSVGYPLFFISFIIMNALLREGSQTSTVSFWIVSSLSVILGPAAFMSFGASQLLINGVSPNPRMLGTINAIALILSNIIRVIAPAIATAVYAAGIREQILHGWLGWLVDISVSAGLYIALRWLPDETN